MKGSGIDISHQFILLEDSPILNIQGNNVEESDKKLVKGTIVEGSLKTRIVKLGDLKRPYKFVELKNKKGYLSPRVLNIYIGKFANLEGELTNSENNGGDVSLNMYQKPPKKKGIKDIFINYGLPIAGGFIGYKIAKRMEADDKKTLGFVVFFGLIGLIPRYMLNK